jgi:hypothetical protein
MVYLIDPAETGEDRIHSTFDPDAPPPNGFSGQPWPKPKGGWESLLCEVRAVRGLHIEVDVCPEMWLESDYDEPPRPPKAPPLLQSSLPEDLRKPLAERLKWMRELLGEDGEGK